MSTTQEKPWYEVGFDYLERGIDMAVDWTNRETAPDATAREQGTSQDKPVDPSDVADQRPGLLGSINPIYLGVGIVGLIGFALVLKK